MKPGKRGPLQKLDKKTAGELAEFWDNILSITWEWPPRWDVGSPDPRPVRSDWDVLCWWCRTVHPASEVEKCMALPTKRAVVGQNGSSTLSALDAGLLKPYSEIWAFLTQRSYPDGTKRQTGRLSLSCGSDGLVLSCTDDQTGQYCTLNGKSLDDLFLAFEAGLAASDLPWRESRFNGRKR